MPNFGLILIAFVSTFAGVWYVSQPPPIVVQKAEAGYALELKAHWAISAKEAERQAALGTFKALSKADDTYGGADKLYQTRQTIRQRSVACLDSRTACTDKRGDDFSPYRRPFAFFRDGTHLSPPAGEAFVAPKHSPQTGAQLIRVLKDAVPRLRALDLTLTAGKRRDEAQTWTARLYGGDLSEIEAAERKRSEDNVLVTNASLLDPPVQDIDSQDKASPVCRTFREAARVKGEPNVPDSSIRHGRACRVVNASGQALLVVSYHKTRQRVRTEDAPTHCASVVRNIVMLEQREGRAVPAFAACIGARFHEHDALDVDVNVFETAANGVLRQLPN
jgi:hypothetical protein